MQKVIPCLWFDRQAEEAAKFYVSLFSNSRIKKVTRYGEAAAKVAGMPKGTVLTVKFELAGQEFLALNGGPMFKFTEAVSFTVNCRNQAEIDRFWKKLSKGGEESRCGWLKDKYGLSWQVVPIDLDKMLQDRDPAKCERVMRALLQMDKLDIKALKQAYNGGGRKKSE